MRTGVIETPPAPWQGAVLPLNHVRSAAHTLTLLHAYQLWSVAYQYGTVITRKTVDKSVEMWIKDMDIGLSVCDIHREMYVKPGKMT